MEATSVVETAARVEMAPTTVEITAATTTAVAIHQAVAAIATTAIIGNFTVVGHVS